MTDTAQPEVLDKDAQKLKKEIELSKRVQKQRLAEIKERTADRKKPSARAKMARHFESPRESWIANNLPEALEEHDRENPSKVTKPATIAVLFDAAEYHKQHCSEGWEPYMMDGEHFQERLDLCYTMPIEIYRERKLTAGEVARNMLNDHGDAMESSDTTRSYGK